MNNTIIVLKNMSQNEKKMYVRGAIEAVMHLTKSEFPLVFSKMTNVYDTNEALLNFLKERGLENIKPYDCD